MDNLGRIADAACLLAPLSSAELERIGVHPAFGAMTVPRWIDFATFGGGAYFLSVREDGSQLGTAVWTFGVKVRSHIRSSSRPL